MALQKSDGLAGPRPGVPEEEAPPGPEVQGRIRAPRTHTQALPQCVTLDNLEAAPSEAALMARALELLAEHHFWAGIVFWGPRDLWPPRTARGPRSPAHQDPHGYRRLRENQ